MMYFFLSIIVLFPVGILLRKIFPEMCAICFAVSATWLVGYMMFNTSSIGVIDSTALGILMGGSAVGSMYLVFSHKAESLQVFKLPYLITLFSLVYMVLFKSFQIPIIILVLSLWFVFSLIYLFRKKQFSKWFKEIIECCKNW